MTKRKWWAALASLALLLALLLGRSLLRDAPAPQGEMAELTTQFLSPVFTRYHRGVRQWTLRFDRVVESPDEKAIYLLERVSEGVWYRDGEPELRFEAERGRWNQETGDLELFGNVRFEGNDGLSFLAPSVHWNAETERLIAPEQVSVDLRGHRLRADRLTFDAEVERVTLEGGVEWIGDDGLRVYGERAIYDQKDDRLQFYGDPVHLDLPAK